MHGWMHGYAIAVTLGNASSSLPFSLSCSEADTMAAQFSRQTKLVQNAIALLHSVRLELGCSIREQHSSHCRSSVMFPATSCCDWCCEYVLWPCRDISQIRECALQPFSRWEMFVLLERQLVALRPIHASNEGYVVTCSLSHAHAQTQTQTHMKACMLRTQGLVLRHAPLFDGVDAFELSGCIETWSRR
jgi:hypothetical protein